MATLKKDHTPKYNDYKDRDTLLSFLLDHDAELQRMADILDVLAGACRTRAVSIGQLIDPPAALPARPATERRQGYRRRDDRTPSPLRLLLDDDRPLMPAEHKESGTPFTQDAA